MPHNGSRLGASTLGIYSEDQTLVAAFSEHRSKPKGMSVTQANPAALLAGDQKVIHALVVLDIGDGALLSDPRFASFNERLAGVPLVVVSDALDPERVRQVVKLRAADWLQRPVRDQDVESALVQASSTGAQARVATIIGASGGAGATTIALMAGRHLAQAAPVALVDLDFQSGSCGAYLNLENQVDLDDVVSTPDRLDGELLDLIKSNPKPNLDVYSFERPDLFFAPTGKKFALRLLDLLTLRTGQVVIDLPNLQTPWFEDVIRHSDDLVVVFETNVSGLRQAKQLLRRIQAIRGNQNGIHLLANKTRFRLFGNPIARSDVSNLLDIEKFSTADRDHNLLYDSVNRALFPSDVAPRARFVKQVTRFLKTALREYRIL